MKKSIVTFVFFLLATLVISVSCSSSDSDSEDLPPLAGEEDQLEGNWWADTMNDGVHFDGAGGGYDLSDRNFPDYCIDTDDPLSYRFDGTTLSVYEDDEVTTGTLTINSIDSATFTVEGYDIDLNRVTVTGNCE